MLCKFWDIVCAASAAQTEENIETIECTGANSLNQDPWALKTRPNFSWEGQIGTLAAQNRDPNDQRDP